MFSNFRGVRPTVVNCIHDSRQLVGVDTSVAQSYFNKRTFSRRRVLSITVVLFRVCSRPRRFYTFIRTAFPRRTGSLCHVISNCLLQDCNFSVANLCDSVLQAALCHLVVRRRVNLLSRRTKRSRDQTRVVSSCPLIVLLCRGVRRLLTRHCKGRTTKVYYTPLYRLVTFCVRKVSCTTPQLHVKVATHSSVCTPRVVQGLLLTGLGPQCCDSIRYYACISVLRGVPRTQGGCSLVLYSRHLSGSPLFLSCTRVQGSLGGVGTCLRVLQSLFKGSLGGRSVHARRLGLDSK